MSHPDADNISEVDPDRAAIGRAFHTLSREHRIRGIRNAIHGGTYDTNSKLDVAAERMIDRERLTHSRGAMERVQSAPLVRPDEDYWPGEPYGQR